MRQPSFRERPARWLSLVAACLLSPGVAATGTEREAADFIRLARDADGVPVALQTAIASYASQDPQQSLQVDLIGVVHVADADYYRQFNDLFKRYDALLYELVAPEGTRIPQGGDPPSGHPVAVLQRGMQNVLGLDSQKDHIDYQAANFVHADLSPAEMAAAMRRRGETPLSLALGALAAATREASQQALETATTGEEVSPLALLLDPQAGRKLKLQLAEQFAAMGATEKMLGKAVNQTLIEDRNEAAMKVLRQQINQGHRRLGIFYGAAHMRDFASRLQEQLDLHPTGTQWLDAWNLSATAAAARPAVSPFKMFLQMLDAPADPTGTR